MVSPGTHLVKNHVSHSRNIESKSKKTVWNWKCLGLYLTRQLIWSHADSKTLYYSILKLNINLLFKSTTKAKRNLHCWTTAINCHRNYTNGIFLQINMFRAIDWSLHPTGRMPWINYLVSWGFLCIRDAGHRGNKSLYERLNSDMKNNSFCL